MAANIILDKKEREKRIKVTKITEITEIIENKKEKTWEKGKHPGGRPIKKHKYENERNDVIKKLNDILGITDKNNIFYLADIDNDVSKQNQIINLENDSKLYFNSRHFILFLALKRSFDLCYYCFNQRHSRDPMCFVIATEKYSGNKCNSERNLTF